MIEGTTFKKLKKSLLELIRGYPDYVYHGKVEFYLESGKSGVDLLITHKIIEELPKEEVAKLQVKEEEKGYRWYRLAPRGVDLAISMINLEHSERMIKYNQETHYFTDILVWFTKILVVATIGTFIFAFVQALITLLH